MVEAGLFATDDTLNGSCIHLTVNPCGGRLVRMICEKTVGRSVSSYMLEISGSKLEDHTFCG